MHTEIISHVTTSVTEIKLLQLLQEL